MNSAEFENLIRAKWARLEYNGPAMREWLKNSGIGHKGFEESADGGLLVVFFSTCTIVVGTYLRILGASNDQQ